MSLEYRPGMESGDNRCAKCSLVILKELTRVMQDLLGKGTIPAIHLYNTIQKDDYFKNNYLNDDQIKMVETLNTHGYGIVDISLAYKLIANYYSIFIPRPSQGWGKEPTSTQTKIGDDIERIRILRNQFVHLVNTNLSVESFNKFFTACIEIGRRVDYYLDKPAENGYARKIRDYQRNPLDSVLQRKHLDALAEVEKLKEKLQCEIGKLTVHVFIGRTIEQACEMITKNGVDGKINIKITFHGIDDSEHNIAVINSMKETFTTENIRVITAVQGCINVFIEFKKKVMLDEVMFESEICTFIRQLCNICELTCMAKETAANAVITTAEEDFECESEINTLEAKCEADKAQEKFTTTLESLFNELAGKENEENMFGNDNMENALDPLVTDDFLSKSRISTPEANSEIDQTSEKFSTTLEGFFNDLAGNRIENNIVGKDDMDEAPVHLVDVEYVSESSTLETNSEVNEAQDKSGTNLEGFIKDLVGKGNENNMVGKDDIDDVLVPLASTGNMSNVVGERNLIDKISTKLTTIVDQASKGMQTIKENNDIIDTLINRETGKSVIYSRVKGNTSTEFGERKSFVDAISKFDRSQEKISTTFEGSCKHQPVKGINKNIEKNEIKDTSFVISYTTGLKRKFDE